MCAFHYVLPPSIIGGFFQDSQARWKLLLVWLTISDGKVSYPSDMLGKKKGQELFSFTYPGKPQGEKKCF